MSFQTALSSGDKDTLRALRYESEVYVLQTPGTNVLVATVDSTPDDPAASVTYTTVSGDYTDVEAGMQVYVARTNGRDAAYTRLVARKAPTSSVLYLDQTSASLQAGDYLFVVDDYAPIAKLATLDADGDVTVAFDVSFRRLLPRITDLPSAAVVFSETTGSIDFAITATAVDTDGGTPTVSWDVGDGTITSGTSSDSSITVSFPNGFRWVAVTATDDNGNTLTRRVAVWVVGEDAATRLVRHGDVTVSRDTPEGGAAAEITLREGVTVRHGETVCVAVREWFDGTEADNPVGDNIAFIGQAALASDEADIDPVAHLRAGGSLTCESTWRRAGALRAEGAYYKREASPDTFYEVEGLTLYRALWLLLSEHSSLTALCDLAGTIADYPYPALNTQGGDLASASNDLARSITAIVQQDTNGRLALARDALLIDNGDDNSTDERANLPTVIDFTEDDTRRYTLSTGFIDRTGFVQASGGSYDTSADLVTTAGSYAPGSVPEPPAATATLDRQVLTANLSTAATQAELNRRAGHLEAKVSSETRLEHEHPGGYWRFVPAVDQWYTFTLDVFARDDVAYTSATRWLLLATTTTFFVGGPRDGTNTTNATYRLETAGRAGETAPLQTTDVSAGQLELPPLVLPSGSLSLPSLNFDLPDIDNWPAGTIPAYTPPPSPGVVVQGPPADGSIALVYDDDVVYVTQNGRAATPTWRDAAPSVVLGANETFVDAQFDTSGGLTNQYGTYLLIADSAADEGRLLHLDNVTNSIPNIAQSAISFLPNRVIPAAAIGAVYVVGQNAAILQVFILPEDTLEKFDVVTIGTIPYPVTGAILEGEGTPCTFGRSSYVELRDDGTDFIDVSSGYTGNVARAFEGGQDELDVFLAAGLTTEGEFSAGTALSVAAGSELSYASPDRPGGADPPSCWPLRAQAWLVIDIS